MQNGRAVDYDDYVHASTAATADDDDTEQNKEN